MKKAKKQIKSIGETALTGAGMSMALGGIGGTSAVQGQAGISKATGYLPATGTMMGVGMMMRTIGKLDSKNKARKGSCGGTPRVGRKGDIKPIRGRGRR